MSFLRESTYYIYLTVDAKKLVNALQKELRKGYYYVKIGLGAHITERDRYLLEQMECVFNTYYTYSTTEPEYVLEYIG